MEDIHRFVGYALSVGFGSLVVVTIYCVARHRPPHELFWSILGGVQVVIGLQIVIGGILFLSGARPSSWLHYVYGAGFPALVLAAAHYVAHKLADIPYVVFGVAAFFCFFSTIRALQTGLGVD